MKTASRRYLFLKVSEFRDFLLETDANVLEPDAFLLGNWALDAVFRGSELVAGVCELKYFLSRWNKCDGTDAGAWWAREEFFYFTLANFGAPLSPPGGGDLPAPARAR